MNSLISATLKNAQTQYQKELTAHLTKDESNPNLSAYKDESPTYAQVVGTINWISRTNRSNFKIVTSGRKEYVDETGVKREEKTDSQYNCFCAGLSSNGYFPIKEGDVIEGICRIVNHPQYGKQLIFDRAPLVPQISADKDSIMTCMIQALRGTGFGAARAFNLYHRFLEEAKDSKKVTEYICKLANTWTQTKDEDMLSSYSSVLNSKLLGRFLSWWYKNQNLRRLYLFGLYDKEIKAIGLPLDVIYEKCRTNPYTLVSLSIEKCDQIFSRKNVVPSEEDRKCAIVIRKIYDYMTNRCWVGAPSRILSSNFPYLPSLMPKLIADYGVKAELFTIYLEEPYQVEVGVNKMLNHWLELKESSKHGDAVFLRPDLTDDQKLAINKALDLPISIITGGAGTGKTTIINEIVHNLELRKIGHMLVSFTGKAVARLREVTGRKFPSTMHRLIARATSASKFTHLIIDESSMVTTSLFHEFRKKFPDNYRITFVGDPNQLEPIGYGALFQQMIESKTIPVFHLSTVHRTAASLNNGILINASKIIEYAEVEDQEELPPFEFEQTDNFSLIDGNIESVTEIVKVLHKYGIKAEQLTIVTPYNKDVIELNKICQQIFNDGNRFVTDSKERVWTVGDRVSLRVNRYDINIMNGEEGVITDVCDDSVLVTFNKVQHAFALHGTLKEKTGDNIEDEEDDTDDELTVNLLRHSFALTVHLSQGSEWDFVILYIPESQTNGRFLNRKLIYTALSRAKKAVWCIGDLTALNLAVVRPAPQRYDNLAKRLRGEGVQISLDMANI